jgi:1-acyl-sn-glycerol-3-phosphate acyltransferase
MLPFFQTYMKQFSTSFWAKFSRGIRSGLFLLVQAMTTLAMSPIVILMWPLPFRLRYRVAVFWVVLNLWFLRHLCGVSYRVHGRENIPQHGSGLIFCKHQSAFETFALYQVFPSAVYILKKELLKIPFWGWAMAALEPIAINRSEKTKALKQVLKKGAESIRRGRWVIIFPEGTRLKPGDKGRYGASGGLLAHRSKCVVIPVAHNAGSCWPRKGFIKYPGTIDIVLGPPIDGSQLESSEINRLAEEWIEQKMHDLPQRVGLFG